MDHFKSLRRFIALAVCCNAALAHAEEKTVYLDLAPKMNRNLTDDLGTGRPSNSLASLPAGEQTLAGIKFNVGPGAVLLGSTELAALPEKIEGIPVDTAFSKLHVLHATNFGGGLNKPGDEWYVEDGTLIGQYVLHFADGSTEGLSILYGRDVRDWWYVDGEKEPSVGKVAWKGENGSASTFGAHIRLYATTYTNPKPDQKVLRIDYLSRKSETPAAPFCLAMTIEK